MWYHLAAEFGCLFIFADSIFCKRRSFTVLQYHSFVFSLLTQVNTYYYTSDSLWKIWLVESIQSIHNSLWTWHDFILFYFFILLFCHTQWVTSRIKTIINRLTNIKFKICALLGRSDCGGEISEKPSLWGIEISPQNDKCNDKCNICCRYCIYHVKFNLCLVTKPLGVFSSETEWLNVFFCLSFKKCIIKQLLNSVFAWYHGFDNSWYHAQPHPIIVYY